MLLSLLCIIFGLGVILFKLCGYSSSLPSSSERLILSLLCRIQNSKSRCKQSSVPGRKWSPRCLCPVSQALPMSPHFKMGLQMWLTQGAWAGAQSRLSGASVQLHTSMDNKSEDILHTFPEGNAWQLWPVVLALSCSDMVTNPGMLAATKAKEGTKQIPPELVGECRIASWPWFLTQ